MGKNKKDEVLYNEKGERVIIKEKKKNPLLVGWSEPCQVDN